MDVHCSTCNEPWDTHHLWFDAIHETDLPTEEAEKWVKLPPGTKLNEYHREKFKAAGWEFGKSLINVIRCPGCPKDAQPDPEKVEIKEALEELLGSDEDSLAMAFEDFGL
jgi:hypothetical protein